MTPGVVEAGVVEAGGVGTEAVTVAPLAPGAVAELNVVDADSLEYMR
jgi:hypothetical protein